MIVCSCNVISDHDIRQAVTEAEETPRSPKQVYGCLGCSAACGRCARTIKTIIDEALEPMARSSQGGCGHDHGHHHDHAHHHDHHHDHANENADVVSEFALAAC